jgi:nucleotide-binding universal stress UspA family protein
MFNRIVVPLDGSPIAENALPYARALARGLKVPVELLCVIDLADVARNVSVAAGAFLDTLTEDESRRLGNYLNDVAKSFSPADVQVKIAKGDAAAVIVEQAADANTLVCMATHGRSGLDRWLLGSVAEKVLRGASAQVLLVRATEKVQPGGDKHFNGVIVPLDGSALAEQVLPYVADLAIHLNLSVRLFRAYEVPYVIYEAGGSSGVDIEGFTANIEKTAREYLEEKCHELRQAGLEKVCYAVTEGNSADEIVKYSRRNPNKLIAMCSHGRSGMKRWMLGSVAETVARHSGAAVLIVRAGT